MVLEKGIPYVECLRFVGDEVPNEVIHRAAGLQISGLFGVGTSTTFILHTSLSHRSQL
jgi:hypothetical protein